MKVSISLRSYFMDEFKLELLIEFRLNKEKKLSKELADILDRINIKRKKIFMLDDKKRIYLDKLRKLQENADSVIDIAQFLRHLYIIDKKINKLKGELELIYLEYEAKYNQLIEATKERKLAEKLNEKLLVAKKNKFLKNEQKFLDEIAINRFFYNR